MKLGGHSSLFHIAAACHGLKPRGAQTIERLDHALEPVQDQFRIATVDAPWVDGRRGILGELLDLFHMPVQVERVDTSWHVIKSPKQYANGRHVARYGSPTHHGPFWRKLLRCPWICGVLWPTPQGLTL